MKGRENDERAVQGEGKCEAEGEEERDVGLEELGAARLQQDVVERRQVGRDDGVC